MGGLKTLRAIAALSFISAILYAAMCTAAAFQAAETSGEKTSSAAIYTGPCMVTAIDIFTDGTNPATVALYDHASTASGRLLFPTAVIAGADGHKGKTWTFPARAYNGLYLTISGTGASASVDYIRE